MKLCRKHGRNRKAKSLAEHEERKWLMLHLILTILTKIACRICGRMSEELNKTTYEMNRAKEAGERYTENQKN